MNPKVYLLVLVLLALAASQKISIEIALTEKYMREDWTAVQKFLNEQKIIRLYQDGITEQSMIRILSLNLTKIEELHFERKDTSDTEPQYRYQQIQKPVLTHRIVRAIFEGDYFGRLRVLNLAGTNIDDRYLRFLAEGSYRSNLEKLSLANCLIGREGFQLLARLELPALTRLNVYGTLLKEAASVEALGTLLCGNKAKGNKQQPQQQQECGKEIAELNIGTTNIERGPFVKLMGRLKAAPLRVLRMADSASLDLLYKSTYREGFDYSAFTALTRFPNLEELELEGCLIDDSVALGFANWTTPQLRLLNLGDNRLSDKGVVAWLTAKNMPSLAQLSLSANEVSDGTIAHFATQQFQFTSLTLGHSKFTAKGIEQFADINTYTIRKLNLAFNMPSQLFNSIILDGGFASLEYLTFESNQFFTNIFTQIAWTKLKKLKYLKLQDISSIKQSLQGLYTLQKPFNVTSLKYLIMENANLPTQFLQLFLQVVPTLFPNLEQLIIREDQGVSFDPAILDILEYNEGTYLDFYFLKMVKWANTYELISMIDPSFIFASKNQDEMAYQNVVANLPTIGRKYNIVNIEALVFQSRFVIDLYARLFEELGITELPALIALVITAQVDVESLLDAFGHMEFPSLRTLQITLVIPADTSFLQIQEKILPFLQKFTQISTLLLYVTFLNEDTGFVQKKEFMDSLYFPHLRQIEIGEQNMEVQEVENFIRVHNQTVRTINLGNNFMEKDFLILLAQTQYMLEGLSLDATSFVVEEFAILGQVKTQFIFVLFLSMCDLTNQHIFAMLAQNKTSPFFPKLKYLNFEGNNIQKQGLEAFLKTQLYHLVELKLNRNSNPDFINLLLTYPTRIASIQAKEVQVYGMQDNLGPQSARSIHELSINSKSFIRSDFQNLAKLSFSQLWVSNFEIFNIYDCKVLLDLLKLNQNAEYINFKISNDKEGLNSSCLEDFQYQSRGTLIGLFDVYGTTYLPEFVSKMVNSNSLIKNLAMYNTRLSPSTFSNILQGSKFGQMQNLLIQNNYLGDEGCRLLLDLDLSNLVTLDLTGNQLTDSCIADLSSTDLQSLNIISLSQNKLTKKGITALSKINAKQLYVIILNNCQLQRDSLEVIADFQIKYLFALDLGYNNFDQNDILEFVANIQRKRLPNLRQINFAGIPLSASAYKDIKSILDVKGILYLLDPPQNMRKHNSAQY